MLRIWFNSEVLFLRNFRRAGVLKKSSAILMSGLIGYLLLSLAASLIGNYPFKSSDWGLLLAIRLLHEAKS